MKLPKQQRFIFLAFIFFIFFFNQLPLISPVAPGLSTCFSAEEEPFKFFKEDFNTFEFLDIEWGPLWSRQEGKIFLEKVRNNTDHSPAILIEHYGEKDWSYKSKRVIDVVKGEIFSFEGQMKLVGTTNSAALSVILYDENKKVMNWFYAKEDVHTRNQWVKVKRSFVVPDGAHTLRFRITGEGPGEVYVDNLFMERKEAKQSYLADGEYAVQTPLTRLDINVANKEIIIEDKINGTRLSDNDSLKHFFIQNISKTRANALKLELLHPEYLENFYIEMALAEEIPEVKFTLIQDGSRQFDYFEFFSFSLKGNKNLYALPLQEGIMFSDNDVPAEILRNFPYGGSLPAPFVSFFDIESGAGGIQIVETPNDYSLFIEKENNKLFFKNRWLSQKGAFGYERRFFIRFFNGGGYVSAAKVYRSYMRDKGNLIQLKARDRRGNIEKLKGAVNVWYWGKRKAAFAKQLYKNGIKKVLFSNSDPSIVEYIHKFGFLSSRYDIYQDAWSHEQHDITNRHEGWPDDLVIDKKGHILKGWVIKKGEQEFPGGVINSQKGLERAKRIIPKDLEQAPYTARFIDTTAASPWREDYHPEHPLTRTQDIKYRMELLNFVSTDLGLITGSENGVDIAVPYTDYFEGMMSIAIGRLPDSGRRVAEVEYRSPTLEFLKYQIGTEYRIPLWELIFHDCVVTSWYWGDSSNRIPEYWWKKDLFNILYGNMPLWAIRDYKQWKRYRESFIKSYNNVSPVFEKAGFAEMLSHRFVTADKKVQETFFEGDIRIFVNFSADAYEISNYNFILPSRGFVVLEKGRVWKQGVSAFTE